MTRHWVQAIVCAGMAAMSVAAAEKEYVCGAGVEVRLSASTVSPGGVVVVEARGGRLMRAEWKGKPVPFWTTENGVQQALLGVDLGQPPGVATVKVTASATAGAAAESCRVPVRVKKVDYGVERLRVARRFLELTPEDEARAEREAKRLQRIFAEVTQERLWSGGFRSPVDVKASGNFGRRRILNGQRRSPHSGEDFPAKLGVTVRAAQRGRVVLADDFFYSGNTVVLDHGLGLFTFYAHLAKLDVKEGELVEAGAQLGTVGATGRVTAEHLHWAARINQSRVNPLELMKTLSE